MIIKDEFLGAVPIPQLVVTALVNNNRKKRGQLEKNGKFRPLDKKCNPQNECTGDSEFAYFTLTEINDWLKTLGIGQIQMDTSKFIKDYGLKVTFGSHFEIGDAPEIGAHEYEPVLRAGVEKYPVYPDSGLINDPRFDLPSKDYLGQQTAILTIVDKSQEISEFKAIIVPFSNSDLSLDVAKLCPPDCNI